LFTTRDVVRSTLTDDIDVESVLDASVVVPDNASVVSAVEHVRFVQANAVASVVQRYLQNNRDFSN